MTPLERALKWQKENPEKRKEIRARWIEKNKERMKKIRKAWKLANPDKVKENRAKWMREHPEARAANQAARRARIAQSGGRFTKAQIDDLFVKQNGLCAICRGDISAKFHRDHIVPLVLNGSNDISNIQLLCPTCNCKKGAKHPSDFNSSIGAING